MLHRSDGATALVGMPGFDVGVQVDVDGEWWLHAQTTADVEGCAACGTRAVGHGRRRVTGPRSALILDASFPPEPGEASPSQTSTRLFVNADPEDVDAPGRWITHCDHDALLPQKRDHSLFLRIRCRRRRTLSGSCTVPIRLGRR